MSLRSTIASTDSSETKPKVSVLGAIAGAILGALVGARRGQTTIEKPPKVQPRTAPEAGLPEPRPFSRETHYPTKPAPDWTDAKPATLPKPSYAPAAAAFGVTLGAAGVVTSFWVSIAGLIVFVLGIANWIGDLVHAHH